jgi:hypothetical protein
MRIPSGSVDRKIYFVAVDATDKHTRELGLTAFTVTRSRNGGAYAAYTTPTIAEINATNMPGVYVLTIDEDTTIAEAHDTEEYCVHITQAAMAPVTRTIELYRPKGTEGRTVTIEKDGVLLSRPQLIRGPVSVLTSQTEITVATGGGVVWATNGVNDCIALIIRYDVGGYITGQVSIRKILASGDNGGGNLDLVLENEPDFPMIVGDMVTVLPPAFTGTLSGLLDDTALAQIANYIFPLAVRDRLARSANTIVLGTVGAGSTITSVIMSNLDPPPTNTNQFNGRILLFSRETTTANLRSQGARIAGVDISGANPVVNLVTADALTVPPVVGDIATIS